MDFMAHLGRETEVQALGRIWKLARFDRTIWRQWMDWAKTQLPDPVEEALKIIDRLPEKVAGEVVRKALDEKTSHLGLGSPKVNGLLGSVEGSAYLTYLLLRKHQPEAGEDEGMLIVFELGLQAMQEKFNQASGTMPTLGNG